VGSWVKNEGWYGKLWGLGRIGREKSEKKWEKSQKNAKNREKVRKFAKICKKMRKNAKICNF